MGLMGAPWVWATMADRAEIGSAAAQPVAMVISPFASHPADAGQRRRVFQTTAMLRDKGYRVIFVFHPFEDLWRWAWDVDAIDAMSEAWDEFHIYPAPDRVGQRPQNGQSHMLDEWWDEDFGTWLTAISRKRAIDVVVAHNVWLSKALTLFPPATVKLLDAHDIFHLRRSVDPVAAAEFFDPSAEVEWFGLSRADLVLAIQESETERMLGHVKAAVRFLPYAAPDTPASPPATDYLFPDRVRFGFIGNGSLFNRRALAEIVQALRKRLALDPAPLELVLAGSVSDCLPDGEIAALSLGRVKDEAEFYDACDIVLSPIFVGTGMKVKSVDALAQGKPTLFSAHAAEGLPIPRDLVFGTPAELVREMCFLAHTRPTLSLMKRRVALAHAAHVRSTRRRTDAVFDTIDARRPVLQIHLDTPDGDVDATVIRACVALGHVRWLSGHIRVELVSDLPALAKMHHLLPPRVGVAAAPRPEGGPRPVWHLRPDPARAGGLAGMVQGGALVLPGPAEPITWEVALRPFIAAAAMAVSGGPVHGLDPAEAGPAALQAPKAALLALGRNLPAQFSLTELIQRVLDRQIDRLYWTPGFRDGGLTAMAVALAGLLGTPVTETVQGPIPTERFRNHAREAGSAVYYWVLKRDRAARD